MANETIKRKLKAAKMPLWKLADYLGVSEPTITRWMRHELTSEKKERVYKAIETYGNLKMGD